MRNFVKILLLKTIIHFAAFIPAVVMYYLAIVDQLGSDPVEEIIHFTGISALNILLITLLVSPVAKYFKQGWLINVRRLLGLYAFFYACLHMLNFLFFELQFDFSLFIGEVIDRPYITIGMLAYAIILLLAVTSWSKIRKKMGKKWQALHNYNYLLVSLVCIHFYWSVKSEIIEPSIYFIMLFILLYQRKDKFKRWFKR
ncbi:protein-methionine-sulfoxide reductase heme-binding subunit MsrQ [Thalassotalea psychrophila]|uniref:Protein-methionine-sulfoxide reductase heme-binding subunit MsrQ n=1 Tax=Thalassotalea psychrophila TaxID=3065647 RepID=A0ABY9TRD2_9GAMM|nr:protein-methionine-sulfoxide reductase heme-binding subunit MsrQ [Colwelliaceae bacterium SQ149]